MRYKKKIRYIKKKGKRFGKRKIRPVRVNMKAESRRRQYERFTILIDMGKQDVSTTGDLHHEFRNFSIKDLVDRQPKIQEHFYVRVKKATLRWKLKNFDPKYQRFERSRTGTYMAEMADIDDGLNNAYFPNADTQAWVNAQSTSSPVPGFSVLYDLNTFSGHKKLPKLHGAWSGMRTFRPYIIDVHSSMYTNNTNVANNELSLTGRLVKSYNGWCAVASSTQASWSNDVRLITPELTAANIRDLVYAADGTTLTEVVHREQHLTNPFYEIVCMVEIECRGSNLYDKINYPAPPAAKLLKRPAENVEQANEKVQKLINEFDNTITSNGGFIQNVRDAVTSHITGSNPVLGAVATMAGINANKFKREELKK